IDLRTNLAMTLSELPVGVPDELACMVRCRVVNLHEPNPALRKPSGGQTNQTKRPGHLVVKTIQLFRLFALFLKPESFWHGHLHTKRKLVGFNTCFQFRITRILYRRNSIEATQHLEFTLLLLLIYTWPGRIKRQWLLTLSVQVYARVFRTQIACT